MSKTLVMDLWQRGGRGSVVTYDGDRTVRVKPHRREGDDQPPPAFWKGITVDGLISIAGIIFLSGALWITVSFQGAAIADLKASFVRKDVEELQISQLSKDVSDLKDQVKELAKKVDQLRGDMSPTSAENIPEVHRK